MPASDFSAYDCYLAVGSTKKGLLLLEEDGVKQYSVALAPTFAPQQRLSANNLYEGQPPEVSVTMAAEDWSGGAGYTDIPKSQPPSSPTVYNYSQGIDLSWGDRAYISPMRNEMVTSNGDSIDGEPLQFLTASFGSLMITENRIYLWDMPSQAWTSVDTSGGYRKGSVEFNGAVFVPRGTSPYIYSTDGLTWTASSRGGSLDEADAFCTRGDDGETSTAYNVCVRLRAGLVSVSTDPKNSGGAWSTEDTIGPTNETAKFITPFDNMVIVWKTEGVYTFDFADVDDFWKTTYLKSDNAANVYQWANGLFYSNYGDRLMEFDFGEGSIRQVYPPETATSPEIKGSITGITGDDTHIYLTVMNAQGTTYLIKGRPDEGWHTTAIYRGTLAESATPASGTNDSTVGTVSWSDPGNITLQDGSYATATVGTSEYLLASQWGFSIPSNAEVNGIEAGIARSKVDIHPTFDAGANSTVSSGTSISWSHTVASEDNRLLVVSVSHDTDAGQSVTGVTYNGDALTLQQTLPLPPGSNVTTEVWAMVAPDTGLHTVEVTFSASVSEATGVSGSFYNVDQATPIGTVVTGTDSTGNDPVQLAIPTEVGDIAYYSVGSDRFTVFSPGTGETQVDQHGIASQNTASFIKTAINDTTFMLPSSSASVNTGSIGFAIRGGTVNFVDNSVRLFKAGVVVGDNKASSEQWGDADETAFYGGPGDLWGVSWTPAEVNANDFGIGLSAVVSGGTARVDAMTMTITYTVPGSSRMSQTIFLAGPSYILDDNPALLSGYGEGAIYFILPRSNMRPEDDTNYRYQTNEPSIVYGPWCDYGGAAYPKFLNRGTELLANTTAGKPVTLSYETDSEEEAVIVTGTQNGLSSGDIDDEVEFNRVRYLVEMSTTGSDTSPIGLGWTLQATLNQPRYRVWTLPIFLANDQPLRDRNLDYWQDSAETEDFLFAATTQRPVFTDYRGRDYNVRINSLDSQGFKKMKFGDEERAGMVYTLQLLEIGPLGTEVNDLVYARDAYGRESDWS